MEKGLSLQNIIAVIWDFDKTLSPHYMQEPLFRAYNIDEGRFWREVHALPEYYRRVNITVQPDTCYLSHLLTYVQKGKMPGLTNRRLEELGAQIRFYEGIPALFERLNAVVAREDYREGDLRLEHYVVSTGLAAMIRGSAIAPYLSGVWASEFVESPAPSGFDPAGVPLPGVISRIAGFLDNTTKTRAIFEINKGGNKHPEISVNDMIPEEERRVPITNMIYIADGPSDIPSFSVIRRLGGLAYALYDPMSYEHFAQVDHLLRNGRVNAYGPADYREGTQTELDFPLIVDNHATHKHPKVRAWLKRHPRLHVHFTPTSSSWTNHVKRWFRKTTDKRIRRSVFKSVKELISVVMDYMQQHNANPRTFVWTAKAEDILAKVGRARVRLDKMATE